MNSRTLKIEAVGDFAACKVKPRIRICGDWLDRAGFKPGHRVIIHQLNSGELTLRFQATDETQIRKAGRQESEQFPTPALLPS